MSKKEIEASWAKSKTRALSSSVNNEFPQVMAKRNVIRRLVILLFNTAPTNISDETKSIINAYNRSTSDEYVEDLRAVSENKTTLGRRTNVIAPKLPHEHECEDMNIGACKHEINTEPTSFKNEDALKDESSSSMQNENDEIEEEIFVCPPPSDDELDF